MSSDRTHRVQMQLPEHSFERLKRLKELGGGASYSEIMKDAIKLYEKVLLEELKGSKFYMKEGEDEPREIFMFVGP